MDTKWVTVAIILPPSTYPMASTTRHDNNLWGMKFIFKPMPTYPHSLHVIV